MQKLFIVAIVGLTTFAATPSYAGGKNGIGVNVGVATGRGGLVGSLLGTALGGGGRNGLAINASVTTGKRGLLGTLLGGGGHGHGHGCGC